MSELVFQLLVQASPPDDPGEEPPALEPGEEEALARLLEQVELDRQWEMNSWEGDAHE